MPEASQYIHYEQTANALPVINFDTMTRESLKGLKTAAQIEDLGCFIPAAWLDDALDEVVENKAKARLATIDRQKTYSFDDAMKMIGLKQNDLDAVGDVEIER